MRRLALSLVANFLLTATSAGRKPPRTVAAAVSSDGHVEEVGGKNVEEGGGKNVEGVGGKNVEEVGGKNVEEVGGKNVQEVGGKKMKKKKAKKAKKPTPSKLMIDVDDLEDRIQPAAPLEVPRSRAAACSVGSASLDLSAVVTSKGTCTLRAAIEMAAGVSGGGSKTVLRLKPGRYRLAAPLPEVTGSVHILGAEGRRGKRKKMASVTLGGAEERRNAQLAFDQADDVDTHYVQLAAGQLGPIGTTLDGEPQHH